MANDSVSTKLRFVSSKEEELILAWVTKLPYKIEIKGNPVHKDGRWFLWFVIPDLARKEVPSGKLD